MDAASADLLRALTAELDELPWLVVTARRDVRGGFVAPAAGAVLHLTPHALPREAALALAEAATDSAPVPPHRLREAVERSGGNPQLLRDLLRSVGAGEETLPDSIETAALARVDRLAPAERTLVRRAAVLGVTFHPRYLADVLDPGTPEPDADTWDRLSDVITEMGEGYLRFRRSVVRDAAYAALPFALRRRLHAAVAARLATERNTSLDELAPALSLHYSRAGDTPEAWTYARLAAGHAAQRLAYADAAVLLRRALEAARVLAVSPHRLAETWESLGDALAHTGELADAHAALRAAREQVGDDPVHTAALLLAHARLAERAGNVPAAVRWANRALRLVDGNHEPAAVACRAQTLSVLATVRQREGRVDDAIALCRRVIAEAEHGADADPGLAASLAHAWFILDWALYDAGRPEEATHSGGALAIYERLGDLDRQAAVLNNLGGFAYHDGRWHDAVELYQRAAEASERAGDTANAAFGACNTGEVLSDQGRLEEARRQLRRALRIWRGSEYDWGTAFATTLLGRAAVRAGRHAEGLDLLEQGLAELKRLRALADVALAEAYIAEALAFSGSRTPRCSRPTARCATRAARRRSCTACAASRSPSSATRTARCTRSTRRCATRRSGRTPTRSRSRSTRSRRSAGRRPAAPRGARRCWSSWTWRRCRRRRSAPHPGIAGRQLHGDDAVARAVLLALAHARRRAAVGQQALVDRLGRRRRRPSRTSRRRPPCPSASGTGPAPRSTSAGTRRRCWHCACISFLSISSTRRLRPPAGHVEHGGAGRELLCSRRSRAPGRRRRRGAGRRRPGCRSAGRVSVSSSGRWSPCRCRPRPPRTPRPRRR